MNELIEISKKALPTTAGGILVLLIYLVFQMQGNVTALDTEVQTHFANPTYHNNLLEEVNEKYVKTNVLDIRLKAIEDDIKEIKELLKD